MGVFSIDEGVVLSPLAAAILMSVLAAKARYMVLWLCFPLRYSLQLLTE